MSTLPAPPRGRSAWLPLAVAAAAAIAAELLSRALGPFRNWALDDLAGLARETRWSDAGHIFLFDPTKILLIVNVAFGALVAYGS